MNEQDDKTLAKEAREAHKLLNDLGVPNVDSSKNKGRFLTLVERINFLRTTDRL